MKLNRKLVPLEKVLDKFFGEPYNTDEYYFYSSFERKHINFRVSLFLYMECYPYRISLHLTKEDKTLFYADDQEFLNIESSDNKLILFLNNAEQFILSVEDWGFSINIDSTEKIR